MIIIIFPLEGFPTLTGIYVSFTPSQAVLIGQCYCASKKVLGAAKKHKNKILIKGYCAILTLKIITYEVYNFAVPGEQTVRY